MFDGREDPLKQPIDQDRCMHRCMSASVHQHELPDLHSNSTPLGVVCVCALRDYKDF